MTIDNLAHPTPRLADLELVILSSAANRTDFCALPIPDSLSGKPDDAQRVIKRLLKRKLLEEQPAKLEDGLWRKDRDERHLTLRITSAGFEALNLDVPEDLRLPPALYESTTKPAPVKAEQKTSANAKTKPKSDSKLAKAKSTRKKADKAASSTKSTSKTEAVLRLLKRENGASLDDMVKATGWQAHSVRGFLSGVVKKKLRLPLAASDDGKGSRRYHLKSRGKS